MNRKLIGSLTAEINSLVRRQAIPARTAAEILLNFSRSVKGREVTGDDIEELIMTIYASDISLDHIGEIEDAENRIRRLLDEEVSKEA